MQPEDLLMVLPVGEERDFVKDLLLRASSLGHDSPEDDEAEGEIAEVIEWLRTEQLKRISSDLLKKINELGTCSDPDALEDLLQRKQKVDRDLRGIAG